MNKKIDFKKFFKSSKLSPEKKLTPEQLRLRDEKKLRKIVDAWKKNPKTLERSDEVMRLLYNLASDNEAGPAFYVKCIKALNVIDNWVQDYIAKNPAKAKKLVSSYIKKIDQQIYKIKEVLPLKFNKFLTLLKQLYKIELKPLELNKLKAFFKNPDWNFKISGHLTAVIIENKQNPNIWKAISCKKFISLFRQKKLDKVFAAITAKYKKEKSQQARLKNFELPKKQKISHIRVFTKEYDRVMASDLHFSSLFARTLKSRYPKMDVQKILFTDNFKKDLIGRIKKAYDKGVRYFSLDLYSHGAKDYLQFAGKPNSKDLINIVKLFPDAKFTINTLACYGGGIGRDFPKLVKADPKVKNRVAIFLQTKPEFVNMGAGYENKRAKKIEKRSRSYSTFYYLFLTRALQQGKTYGEAVVEADRLSQKYMYLDPESIINGELFVEKQRKGEKTSRVV